MSIARYLDDRLTVIVITSLDSEQCEAGGNRERGCRRVPAVTFAQKRKVPAADGGRYKTLQTQRGIRLGAI
jgi:hypothetical protein